MDRRNLLKMAAVAAVAGISGTEAMAQRGAPARVRVPEMVEGKGGTRLFLRDWGSGPPILFMAGWTLPSDFWGYQMASLAAAGFRCLAYDRRGHGRSADPGGGYDFDTLADDLAAILDRLQLRRVTLVSHSMASGELARYFARHGGGRIARVVLVSPTTPFLMRTEDNPMGLPREAMAASRAPLALDFPGRVGTQFRPFFTAETSPDMIDWCKQLMFGASLQAVLECARALMETDFRADLPRINVPALVIHGDRDVSAPLPLTGQRTAALVPGARLSVYEGAPHGLPLTHVERLNAELLSFARVG